MPEAPFTLGVVLWQTGRADEAAEQFRNALARKPDYAEAHYMLGTVLKQQGALSQAVSSFRESLKFQPNSAEAHRSLGQTLKQLGQHDAAEAELAEADRLNQRTADAQASTFAVSVGVQKLKAGDRAGAIERFREADPTRVRQPSSPLSARSGAAADGRPGGGAASISLKRAGSRPTCGRRTTSREGSSAPPR